MYSARSASTLLARSVASTSTRRALGWRALHATRSWNAVTRFAMPAMSPTMSEGGIAQWKVKEGDGFHAGDVLLEIETDKATIDVEAQEDGVLGKILAPEGSKNVPVGKIIALITEEGDDISNLRVPEEVPPKPSQKPVEESKVTPSKTSQSALQQSTPQPVQHNLQIKHSKPLSPSVQRLVVEYGIEDADRIKGTGVRGMLTKGDVLAFLGKASSPLGTYKPVKTEAPTAPAAQPTKGEMKPLDGQALRQVIVSGLVKSSLTARAIPPPDTPYDFDSVINDYLPAKTAPTPKTAPSKSSTSSAATDSYFNGLL